jgi:hypothetical protein
LKSVAKNINEPHLDFPKQALTSLWSATDAYEFTEWKLRVFDGEVRVLSGERGKLSKIEESAKTVASVGGGLKATGSGGKDGGPKSSSKPKVNELIFVKGGQLPGDSGLAGKGVGDFRIAKYEVMFSEWKEVRDWAVGKGYDFGGNGSGTGEHHPVNSVSWFEALKWCNARSEREGLGFVYRLDGSTFKRGQPNVAKIDAKKRRLATASLLRRNGSGPLGEGASLVDLSSVEAMTWIRLVGILRTAMARQKLSE